MTDAEDMVCADCGARLVGRWCHACGEDSAPAMRGAADLLEDFLDNVMSFTDAAPRTVVALFTRPSLVPRAQRSGERKSFLTPVKLYVTASLLFFLFLGLSGVSIFQVKVERTGEGPVAIRSMEEGGPANFRMTELWLHPPRAAPRDAEVVAAFDAALPDITDDVERTLLGFLRRVADDPSEINETISTWGPRLLWLMMPLHALLLWPLFRKGRLLTEHIILSLWAHGMIFLLLIGGALWNMAGLSYGLVAAMVAYQVYLTLALRGYYDTGWRAAVLKGAVHSFAYLGLLWLPIVIAFFLAEAMSGLPASYWGS